MECQFWLMDFVIWWMDCQLCWLNVSPLINRLSALYELSAANVIRQLRFIFGFNFFSSYDFHFFCQHHKGVIAASFWSSAHKSAGETIFFQRICWMCGEYPCITHEPIVCKCANLLVLASIWRSCCFNYFYSICHSSPSWDSLSYRNKHRK